MRTNNSIKTAATTLLIALMTVSAMADDWPNWRGPHHNGISDEVDWADDWADCEPTELWTRQVGTGFSSIAVADGRVYTMGNTSNTDRVFCLDAGSGNILWTYAYSAALASDQYEGGPSATPTVANGNVFTLSKQGMAYCLDAIDGAVLWRKNLVADYGMLAPRYGFAGSAYVEAELVVYNAGTHGLALHAADGTPAWQTGTGIPGYSTPAPFDFRGQRYLALMGEKTFAAVRTQTGDVLWEYPWVTRYNANIPDPIVDSDLVFVSTGYQEGSALFNVSTGQVSQVWFQKNMQTWLNGAVLWQGYLYGPNDNGKALTCVRRSNGSIMWSEGGFGNGSVTLADGKLIILSQSGDLCIAEASPTGYQELIRYELFTAGTCWSVPVLANGKIYARNATGKLVCVQLRALADAGLDFYSDGKIDFGDFAIFGQCWREYDLRGDVFPPPTGDGVLDYRDAVLLAGSWLMDARIPPLEASDPVPAHEATLVDVSEILQWTAGRNAQSHNVYFGTVDPPPFVVNQAETEFAPGAMEYETLYYWRIDAVSASGTSEGQLWQFTTGPSPR